MEVAQEQWDAVAGSHPGLALLVLLGSRARGQEHAGSDWDLGFLADPDVDRLALHADLTQLLGTDAVDLVDLRAASAVLRRDAAAHGQALVGPAAFVEFAVEATLFWCDIEPVVREAHDAVLRATGR